MRASLRRLFLSAVRTDTDAALQPDGQWRTRCLHCRTRLQVASDGTALGASSLEHVVPRAWFGRRAAAALVARVGTADDPRNLAVACARCNQDKGKGPDARGPSDDRAYEVVEALLDRRLSRWREAASEADAAG